MSELEKYKNFFNEIRLMTLNHDVLNNHAVVYPFKLDLVLRKIDPNWVRKAQ